jgi:hypothetical protein
LREIESIITSLALRLNIIYINFSQIDNIFTAFTIITTRDALFIEKNVLLTTGYTIVLSESTTLFAFIMARIASSYRIESGTKL